MTTILGALNLLLCLFVIKQTLRSWCSTCLALPLCISLIFYTLWPISEQLFWGIAPLQGVELSEQSLWELSLINLSTLLLVLSFATFLNIFLKETNPLLGFSAPVTNRFPSCSTGLLLLGVVGLLYSTDFSPHKLSDYEENMVSSYFSVWIPISKALISYACALRFVQVISERSKGILSLFPRGIFWFSIPLCLAVFTSDKDPLLPLACALIYLLAPIVQRLRVTSYTAVILVSCLFIQFCLLYFSVIRGGGNYADLSSRLRQSDSPLISITASDPGGPYISLSHQFNLGLPDSFKFELAERVLSIVPQHLLDSKRPDTLDIAYAKFMMQKFDAGNGLGFHPLAQASLDFGIASSWSYILLIFLFGFLPLLLITKITQDSNLILLAGLVVSSAFIISHRMPIESTFKSIFTYSLVLTPAYLTSRAVSLILHDIFSLSNNKPTALELPNNRGGYRAGEKTF